MLGPFTIADTSDKVVYDKDTEPASAKEDTLIALGQEIDALCGSVQKNQYGHLEGNNHFEGDNGPWMEWSPQASGPANQNRAILDLMER
jgi:hypothetical protein